MQLGLVCARSAQVWHQPDVGNVHANLADAGASLAFRFAEVNAKVSIWPNLEAFHEHLLAAAFAGLFVSVFRCFGAEQRKPLLLVLSATSHDNALLNKGRMKFNNSIQKLQITSAFIELCERLCCMTLTTS